MTRSHTKPLRRLVSAAVAALSWSSCVAQSLSFEDVAAASSVAFQFDAGSRGRHDLPEIMGGGVALFDADGDGLPDLYFCNGGPIGATAGAVVDDPPCRFFRNRGGLHFEDRTATCGAPGPNYAMGAAAGDFDGDGRTDLFVTGWRDQRLYRNLGECRFEDVTVRAGLTSSAWSTGAAWADLDGDGDLDLYVAGYLNYDPDAAPYCAAPDGKRDYCGPEDFDPQSDRLYRNDGGRFTDVSRAAGIPRREERGLGVLIGELTGDRMPDVYVANDGGRCWLLANRGGLRFDEVGEAAGVARDDDGKALAGMGTALGDLDGDGRPDLLVTNFFERSTVVFRAQPGHPGLYRDEGNRLGVAAATRRTLGFGAVVADFDADGRSDIVQVNGHVLDRERLGVPFAMRSIVLHGRQGGFEDVSHSAGGWLSRPILGRGLAVGDLDDDGRLDLVAASLDAPAALLLNRSKTGGVVRLDLINRHGRPAVGARVRATVDGRILVQDVTSGGSYLSCSPSRIFLGIGGAARVDVLEVAWPWGEVQTWTDLRPGRPQQLLERPPGDSGRNVTTPNPDATGTSAPLR
ncbi:MAG: CRTAC1 family protein [Paludisphaera borealis]|uniref:CRTAC1 family protein n=1 Tax=Paludisphaera borealis TaxID=1387353 RepID=UPI00284D895D|nr:CRTAC1 family protein [Paludisphaera borealis]MDR3619911.1 CRTAC1 family protein [Paludisphaera borealis]